MDAVIDKLEEVRADPEKGTHDFDSEAGYSSGEENKEGQDGFPPIDIDLTRETPAACSTTTTSLSATPSTTGSATTNTGDKTATGNKRGRPRKDISSTVGSSNDDEGQSNPKKRKVWSLKKHAHLLETIADLGNSGLMVFLLYSQAFFLFYMRNNMD